MAKKHTYIDVVKSEHLGTRYHSQRLNTLHTVTVDSVEILKVDGKTEWLKKKRINNAHITTKRV